VEQSERIAHDLAPESWPDLHELRPGDASEIPDDELEDAFLGPFRGRPAPSAAYLNGETVGSLMTRVGGAMDRLFADHGWDTILLVLHGGVNRAILSWALAGTGHLFAQFEQSPGCINIIDGEPGLFVVRAVNLTPNERLHDRRTTTVETIFEQYRAHRKAIC